MESRNKRELRGIDFFIVSEHPHVLRVNEVEIPTKSVQPGRPQPDLQANDLADELVCSLIVPCRYLP